MAFVPEWLLQTVVEYWQPVAQREELNYQYQTNTTDKHRLYDSYIAYNRKVKAF